MSAPNRFDLVKKVNEQHPHLLRLNTHESCAEFQQRFVKEANAGSSQPEWGFTEKREGENGYTFSDGRRISTDSVTWKPWNSPQSQRWQVDIINSSGAGCSRPGERTHVCVSDIVAPGSPSWIGHDPSEYRPHNIWLDPRGFPQLKVGGDVQLAKTKFGTHWFPFMRSQVEYPEHQRNWDWWMRPEHKPDGFRVFSDVDGQRHARNGVDPWQDAKIDHRDAHWDDRFTMMLDTFERADVQLILCLHGGRGHFGGWGDQQRYYDKVRRKLEGRFHVLAYVEPMNEFDVNGWSPDEVKKAGRYLKSIMPAGTLIALSSPALAHAGFGASTEEMRDSFRELYGDADHGGANLCTVHVLRDESRWGDPASYNIMTPLPKSSNEARAPNSYLPVSDVNVLKRDAQRTKDAGWLWYVPVFGWGVFCGYIPSPPFSSRTKLIEDEPNADAVVRAWKEVLHGESGQVPAPSPQNREWLRSGETLKPGEELVSANGEYKLSFQNDCNLVHYKKEADGSWVFLWDSRTQNDGTWPKLKNAKPLGLVMQPDDGNCVLYVELPDGRIDWAWNSRTQGNPGARLLCQNDAQVAVYDSAEPPQPIRSILDDGGKNPEE